MVSAAEQLAANLNFSALAKAEELKKRIWFTLGALLVYRFGTYIPLPGIDPAAWDQIFKSQAGGILGMFNMFAGGGIHRMAIFALNIMPYISASIIIQLMTTVSPTLESRLRSRTRLRSSAPAQKRAGNTRLPPRRASPSRRVHSAGRGSTCVQAPSPETQTYTRRARQSSSASPTARLSG
jgi:hypothetical protein